MDQISFEKVNQKDILKDSLSFKSYFYHVKHHKGLSKGHFVPYRSNVFVASFSWTLQQSKAVKSYLIPKLQRVVRRFIFCCKSTDSLFDSHLIVGNWNLLILKQS